MDVSPLWPEKQHIISGSADGSVKQWNLEELDGILNMKTIHSHDIHLKEKEVIFGVINNFCISCFFYYNLDNFGIIIYLLQSC